MKRLFASVKFWLALCGVIFGNLTWINTKDVTITSLVIGLFGGGIVGSAGEDIAKSISNKRPSVVDNADNVNIN